MNRNIFDKTRIAGWETRLAASFPYLNRDSVSVKACEILTRELTTVSDRGNKAIGWHIRANILPGYACYRALLCAGVGTDSAVSFVETELCRSVERMSRLCGWLSTKTFAYPLVMKLLRLALRFGYPKEGWTMENMNFSATKVSFEITSCLYFEELQKRCAPELCQAFCQTDHASYDPLAPGVLFNRNATFAQNGKVCDFCFVRGN